MTGTWRPRLLLPPGWVTLHTDEPERTRREVKRLVGQRTAHLSRDETAAARRRASSLLLEQLGDARRAGAVEMHVLAEPIRGLPVSASVTVTPLPARQGEGGLLEALAGVSADRETTVDVETATLVGQPALRRLRRASTPPPPGRPDAKPRWSTFVDWLVVLPDEDMLLLTFSTESEKVVDELVELFDAMAGALELLPPH